MARSQWAKPIDGRSGATHERGKMTDMPNESKLIPILRDGVHIIKMVFFKELKAYMEGAYPQNDAQYASRLAGTVINDLFATPNDTEPFASFAKENAAVIDKELNRISDQFVSMKIALSDALRVQFLCDDLEGINSQQMLSRAKEAGILIMDREIPLPRTFLNLARKLGVAHNILDAGAVND